MKCFWARLASVVSIPIIAAVGCSTSGGDAGHDAVGPVGSVATGTPTLDQLYAGIGMADPPSVSPPPAVGKDVWFLYCGAQDDGCTTVDRGAEAAGAALGFKLHSIDGKQNIGGAFAAGIRTAVASGADALIAYGVACPSSQQAFQEAHDAGVKLIGMASVDCDTIGGPKLFDAQVAFTKDVQNSEQWFAEIGKMAGYYLIAKTGGTAKLIYSSDKSFTNYKFLDEGFRSALAECRTCSIDIVEDIPMALNDSGVNGPWIQAFRTALIKHPEATAAYVPWDYMLTSVGAAKAVSDSGNKLLLFGGQGTPPSFNLVNQRQVAAITSAQTLDWMGWAAVDTANRVLNGQPAVPQGNGFRVLDAQHGLPASGQNFIADIDYQAAYKKSWGVG